MEAAKRMMTRDEFDSYIKALLRGEQKPLNETVGYLVDKYRESRMRYQIAGQAVAKLKNELKAAQDDFLRGEGEVNSYAADLEHFCDVEPQSDQPASGVSKGPAEENSHGRDNGKTGGTPAGVSVIDRRSVD